jgi:hypothetical protein
MSSMDSSAVARLRPQSRSRITNRPNEVAVDGRSKLGRRVRDIADSLAGQLGGWNALPVGTAANVRRAAELLALAEQARADALALGHYIGADRSGLVQIENLAARAVKGLGLRRLTRFVRP